MLNLVEKITGKKLRPTYTYLSFYIKGAELKAHLDRLECGYTCSFIIDKPEDSTLLYTIGNPESESANWLPLPTDEIPLSKGSYNFFVINQSDGYPFGSDNAFTISEILPI